MMKHSVSAIALCVALGLSPAAFAQDQTQEQPAAQDQGAQQQGGAEVIIIQEGEEGQAQQPAEGQTTTQTEGQTTTQEVEVETTTQPAQAETTTQQPAEGQQMQVETVPAEDQQQGGEQTQQVQTEQQEGQPVPGQIFQQSPNQYLGSTLMDATVQSTEGENIGEVGDIIIDQNGQVAGVVIGVGGFLGIGERDIAVQLSQITIQQQEGDVDDLTFVLNATREELENAPEFRTQEDQQAEQNAQDAATDAGTGAVTTQPAADGTTTTTTEGTTTEEQSQ